jgi:hypothetical protein
VRHTRCCRPFSESFQPLEPRALFSAPPTVSDIQFSKTLPVIFEPVRISVLAQDDVGVRGVSFFIDRNQNGLWDEHTDQPLGDDFEVDGDGRFSVTATPDGSWDAYPHYSSIIAGAVDTEGQWSTTGAQRILTHVGKPVITSVTANLTIMSEGPDRRTVVTLRAKADEPLVYPYGISAITFFLDRNFNAVWDAGIDQDLGSGGSTDGNGYRILSANLPGISIVGQYCAAARSSSGVWSNVAVADVYSSSSVFSAGPPVITHATWEDLDRPGISGVLTGERMRIKFVAGVDDLYTFGRGLAAVTLFFDTNFDRSWTPGVDIDLGGRFFADEVVRGRGQYDFVVTPQMNFDYRAFCLAAKATDGSWGPTYSIFPKIISRPWVENVSLDPQPVAPDGQVTVDLTARDDHATREIFAFIDKDNDGLFDEGEAYAQGGTRLGFNPRAQRWEVTIDLAGLGYQPGQYRLGVFARDHEGAQGRTAFFTVTVA